MPSANDNLVRLATAANPQEAELWRQLLEEAGIRCRVVGEYLGSFGVVYPGQVAPELWVLQSDVERGQTLLEQSDTKRKARPT